MKRTVRVGKCRAEDIEVGDVVATFAVGRPSHWFKVARIADGNQRVRMYGAVDDTLAIIECDPVTLVEVQIPEEDRP